MPAPGLKIAQEYLVEALNRQIWRSGDRLPSLAELAKAVGVSRITMWKAVGSLAREGRLQVVRGGYISVRGGTTSPGPTPESGRPKHLRIRQELQKDILNGSFASGSILSTQRELQSRYGASYATVRRSLLSLAAEKIIVPEGRRFMVPKIPAQSTKSAVVLITDNLVRGSVFRGVNIYGEWSQKIVATLEERCAPAAIQVVHVKYEYGSWENHQRVRERCAGGMPVLGFVVYLFWAYGESEPIERAISFIKFLTGYNLPVTIVDDAGTLEQRIKGRIQGPLRIFSFSARTAGAAIGRRLLSLGHRSVAYLSIHHGDSWSIDRFLGLCDPFQKAGFHDSVKPFTVEKVDFFYERILRYWGSDRALLERVLRPDASRAALKERLALFDNISRKPMTRSDDHPISAVIESNLRTLKSLADESERSPEFFVKVRNFIFDSVSSQVIEIDLEPLLARALATPGITAWVASNCEIAGMMLRFLESRKIAVPQQISVVEFDNDVAAFDINLASYDFNISQMAVRMLETIVNGGRAALKPGPTREEVEGMLIERDSLGKARGSAVVPNKS